MSPKRTFDNGNTFGQNIKAEIMEFRGRLDSLEAQMRTLAQGSGTANVNPSITEEPDENPDGSGDFIDGKFYKDIEPETENVKNYSEEVMKATYLLHEAATAVRGYGQLLTEMGLSKDQKKMVHELEEGMMMALKFASMLRLLLKAQEEFDVAEAAGEAMGPLGYLEIILAGGMGAASMSYGMKLTGGGI